DIFGDVERVPSQYGGEAIALPIRMVRSRAADANTDRPYDPHAAYPVHSESGGHACYLADCQHHDGIYLPFSAVGGHLGMVPLPTAYFIWLAGILSSYCLLTQLVKMIYIRRFGQWL